MSKGPHRTLSGSSLLLQGLLCLLAMVGPGQRAAALPSSFMADGTVLHGGEPFFPLGLYAENGIVPWDVVPALQPAITGQALAARLVKSGWNTMVDYGVGTAPWAPGSKVNPDLIKEYFDGLHNVGMTVIMNLDSAVASPLDKTVWFDNTTEQAIKLSLGGVVDHPALLAVGYSTEGQMMSFQASRTVSQNLAYIQGLDTEGHVVANLGLFPMDSVTYRNDLGTEFCPRDVLAHPEQGCLWNGAPCGAAAHDGDGLCGPGYYELFDHLVPSAAAGGGQFAFGAQEYGFPASPEALNATCQKAGWGR